MYIAYGKLILQMKNWIKVLIHLQQVCYKVFIDMYINDLACWK